ncbi:hypothetical protein CKO42_25640 [Lamprobacter modestohalophilus]|uniref:Uncharacterized protein n=1 Tax=Lamprobacter modestohalophilus TaxID=1064514 RepID=A0A9X0WEF8_9GAMM|nr:hypothetical protein [Lamprobacter modestohalophilus]MBK1621710.1 hypothetical protein [Lamprobacter modestohalophilus]
MIDPSLYRFRERLTLLECAALAHGRDPRELQRRFEESLALDYGPHCTRRQIKELAVSREVAETVDALEAMTGADAVTPPFGVFRFPPCECQAMLAALGLSLPWTLDPENQREAANTGQSPSPDNWREDPALLKGEKQDRAVAEIIKAKGFNPSAIPDGEKGTIEQLCTLEYPELFKFVTAFETAWKRGLKAGRWRMQSHASYAKRGKD